MSFADQGIVTSKAITTESPQNSARWITPRNVLRLGIAVVALHIFQEAFLDAAASSLIANLLQIFSALLAATTCFVAIRRSSGFTRSFWLLIGLSSWCGRLLISAGCTTSLCGTFLPLEIRSSIF